MNALSIVPDSRATLQGLLCDARLRRIVASIVRRRVPPPDVEDVVQTVYCDALAAPRLPVESELPAWLVGIARHKVSDYLRAKQRDARAVDPDEIEPAHEPAPFEARDLLARVLDEEAREPRARETLSWLLREHEGEPLASIAVNDHIVADSFMPVAATTVSGAWRVTFVEPTSNVDVAPRAELWAEAAHAHVEVVGDRVVVSTPTRRREYAMTFEARGTEAHAHLVGTDGNTVEVTLRLPTRDRAVVDVAGAHGARIVLERQLSR